MNAGTPAARKILVFIGIDYAPGDESVWYREAGLIARSLRSLGEDAWLVVAGKEFAQSENREKPLMVVPREKLEDAEWWKSQSPWAVVFMLWGSSRFEPIRRAALRSTPRIMEKLDTDGVKSPRVWFWEYVRVARMHKRDHGKSRLGRFLAPLSTLAQGLVVRFLPGLLDKKLTAGLSRIPVVAAESPIAVERVRRWIGMFGDTPPRMACIHHPVDETDISFDPSVPRENKIVSVGRMNTSQKNLPLMLQVLGEFLARRPDWSADIVGRLPENLEILLQPMPAGVRDRIRFPGFVPHDELAGYYRGAKIYFLTSRHEAFCNTVSEALCCGCSVSGPADSAGIPFVAGYASGTVACRQTKAHFLDALNAEVLAWEEGWRDPQKIAKEWSARVGAKAVGRKILATLESIEG